MKNDIGKGLKNSRTGSIITILLAIALLVYMITVEGELGALPLLLMLTGCIWFTVTQLQIKKARRNSN